MKKKILVSSAVLAGLMVVVAIAVVEIDGNGRDQRQEKALISEVRELEARFFYRHRPELEWLAVRPEVQETLAHSLSSRDSPALSVLLQQAQGLLGLDVVYLIDSRGLIVAASDGQYIGADLSFREYYRKGMNGLPGYAIATGAVTQTRGLYASVPVFHDGTVVGVIAFRTASHALEHWQSTFSGLVLLDPDGRIFSSSDPESLTATWKWTGPSRVVIQEQTYRVARAPLDVVPGFAAASLVADDYPWSILALAELVLLLVFFAAFSIWRQLRLVRDRRKANRDQQQRELLLSHLLEGIAVFDSDGRLTWANPVFERLIQREPETPVPTLADLWDRAGPGPWQEVLDGRRPWVVFESVLRGRQGGWIPVSAGFTSAEGRFILSVLDGTERYQSEQLIQQSQKLTVLGQLSGGIAHDLNNMLGVLMGMADLLKMSLPEQDPLQESVDLILSTLSRAAGLSERMLNFARQTPMNRVPLDVTALLRELRFLMRTALPEGVQTELRVPEGPFFVNGDENLLLSAILNLILNAAESMPDGGLVRVTGEVLGLDEFQISVEDQGKGMDKATLARIFEPFFSTKLDHKGTGLGLSLVRRTILEHRGSIHVESQLGKGTLVTVRLPLTWGSPAGTSENPVLGLVPPRPEKAS